MKIYYLIFTLTMIITNLFSINVLYSIFSGLFVVGLFVIMFNVAGAAIIKINRDLKLKKFITNQLLFIQIISITGNFLIPHWNWDSTLRFSGGIGPNMMAFISLFSVLWFMDIKIDSLFKPQSVIGIFLSIITLLWTMSRGRIIGLIFLIIFLFLNNVAILLNSRLNYKFSKSKAMVNIVVVFIITILSPVSIKWIMNSERILMRLTTSGDSRLFAWNILMEAFKDNIIFGSLGWWNANDTIRQYSFANMATSAHNFYLRVLSEIGILGLIVAIAFPTFLVLKSLKVALMRKDISRNRRKKLLLYSGGIVAFFITQIVEDQYLNGIGDFQMGLFIWLFALSYYYLNENKYSFKRDD